MGSRRQIPFARSVLALAVGSVAGGLSTSAYANAVIFNTGVEETATVALGVNAEGHLNIFDNDFQTENAGAVGLAFRFADDGLFYDATSPGCLCEGWGVAVSSATAGRVSAFASEDNGGSGGIDTVQFGSDGQTATSIVTMTDAPVTITHAYGPSLASNVFQGNVTITNNGPDTLTDLVYRRAMDWDIPRTEFDEYVTHQGVEANLEANGGNVRFAGDDGFVPVDPLVELGGDFGGYGGDYGGDFPIPADGTFPVFGEINPGTANSDFVDNGPTDHGSVFDFAFGDLAAGESRTFNIFYGAAENEADALAAIATLGADLWSLGQSNPDGFSDYGGGYGGDYGGDLFDASGPGPGNPDGTPATFLFAFGGVDGIEPGEDQENPILPFVPAPASFEFPAPVPRRWYDPPSVGGFEYELVGGGAFFTEVGAPVGFDDLIITVNGVVVDSDFDGGEFFDFTTLGVVVTSFTITGIAPLLDPDDPGFTTAFPTFLDFSGTPTELLMTGIDVTGSVPGPAPLGLIGLALFGIGLRARRRS